MSDGRTYGEPPVRVVVVHGGPGSPGSMAPVARRLGSRRGVFEPFQRADSLIGQVVELRGQLDRNSDTPVVLVGSSWGAMLGFVFTATFGSYVSKLVMVGSGVFDEHYAPEIDAIRRTRLTGDARTRLNTLLDLLDAGGRAREADLAELGRLLTRADAYDPVTLDTEAETFDVALFAKVWPDMQALRRTGELVRLGEKIHCPVVAIHGDHDPHPIEGIERPLRAVLRDVRFVRLDRCGHLPWIERHAADRFFEVLEAELG